MAEEVEKVDPDLVARDDEGRPYSVRYEAVNAMLLNEFLKEHSTVQEQQKEIDALKAQLKEQAALIQKVSARVEASNPHCKRSSSTISKTAEPNKAAAFAGSNSAVDAPTM